MGVATIPRCCGLTMYLERYSEGVSEYACRESKEHRRKVPDYEYVLNSREGAMEGTKGQMKIGSPPALRGGSSRGRRP